MAKKPVVLIAGYLGSGKTTLLNNLLRQEQRKVSLIVNDMGSINVDAALLKKNGSSVAQSEMFELQNGCICCTLRDEFIDQIEKISKNENTEVVFVEASGISDTGAVSASFLAYEEDNPDTNVYLSAVVTVVDGDRIYHEFLDELRTFDEEKEFSNDDPSITTLIVDQMEFCNYIVLNKCDLLTDQQQKDVIDVIRTFQPKAKIIPATNSEIDPNIIMTGEKFNYEMVDSSSCIQRAINSLGEKGGTKYDEYGITSFSYEEKRPFNRQKFADFVNTLDPKKIVRAKGYIWFSDADEDVQLFEQAGRNNSVMEVSYWVDALIEEQKNQILQQNPDMKDAWDEKYGDRMNQVVFIGKDYNEAEIKMQLENCLDEWN